MIIIGERINTSRKFIEPAVVSRDFEFIKNEAINQFAAGATHIDVNAGTLINDEPAALAWLVETVQAVVNAPLCIDSPNPKALEAGLKIHRGKAMINSITGEKERYRSILPLIKEYGAEVVALAMDDNGMPCDAEGRIRIASALIEQLSADGIPLEDIYIDPLIQPISTSPEQGIAVLETIQEIMRRYPGVHTICGLSNISYGLPQRKLLNRSFLIMCMQVGLDAVIMDPLDREMMACLYASQALLNKDEYCMQYIQAHREGKLE
ncbi:MAG: methyltetrahydrofolate cobalamin methyltransferase [Bacillota bacterium]